MQAHSLLMLMTALVTNLLAFTELDFGSSRSDCSVEHDRKTTCQCCKTSCWYNIVKKATNNLGHIPGENGEQEALDTLHLIRLCILLKCGHTVNSNGKDNDNDDDDDDAGVSIKIKDFRKEIDDDDNGIEPVSPRPQRGVLTTILLGPPPALL